MASSQINPKNKKDTLRAMFDDSHADGAADAEEEGEEDLDDSVKDKDFDPTTHPDHGDPDTGDEVEIVDPEEEDPALSQVRKANVKLQKSVKDIPGLHPEDKVRFEKYNAVIWNFFTRSVEYNVAKKAKTPFGTCKVVVSEVNGLKCGVKIASPQSNTTAMRNHLKSRHNAQHVILRAIEKSRLAEATGAKRALEQHSADVEGTPAKKQKLDDPKPGTSSNKSSQQRPSQIFNQADKAYMSGMTIPSRSGKQLKFDMAVTQYIAEGNLAFNHVASAAFKNLLANVPEMRQYNIKNPSTYSRAKLPLLYDQVKEKVDAMIKRDLKGTSGFAFTSDLWSSR